YLSPKVKVALLILLTRELLGQRMIASARITENPWTLMDIKNRLEVAYANRSALITGGASFIGSHLAELLVDLGAVVTVADDLSTGHLENLATVQSQVKLLKGDLREPEFAKIACADQNIIFHLAASHGGRGYIDTHPVECTNNMLLDHTVFAAAADAGAAKIVF